MDSFSQFVTWDYPLVPKIEEEIAPLTHEWFHTVEFVDPLRSDDYGHSESTESSPYSSDFGDELDFLESDMSGGLLSPVFEDESLSVHVLSEGEEIFAQNCLEFQDFDPSNSTLLNLEDVDFESICGLLGDSNEVSSDYRSLSDIKQLPEKRFHQKSKPAPLTAKHKVRRLSISSSDEFDSSDVKWSSVSLKRKKEQNKKAATKYRKKKRQEETEQVVVCEELIERNEMLKRVVKEKEQELKVLKQLLLDVLAR